MSKYFDSENLTFMAPEVKEHGRHMVMTNVHKDTKIKYKTNRTIRLSLNIKSNSLKFALINSIHGITLNNKRTNIKKIF